MIMYFSLLPPIPSLPPAALCVVGNKCDLTGEREVPKDRGEAFAHQLGALFTETSAAENMGNLKPTKPVYGGVLNNSL